MDLADFAGVASARPDGDLAGIEVVDLGGRIRRRVREVALSRKECRTFQAGRQVY